MSRKAVIDIGSNSIKFFVGELADNGTIRTVIDTNDITRLGEGLDKTGIISQEALDRNTASVAAFHAKALEEGAEQIVAVGTMALRTASNREEFVQRVRDVCGLEVKILPGKEEARLSYLAALSSLPLPDGDLVVFDTGGGSTEFIFGRGRKLLHRFSVNLGSIRISENDLGPDPVTPEKIDAVKAQIDRELTKAGVAGRPVQVVGMGGTVTTMGAVKHKMAAYDPAVIQGSTLTREDVRAQIELYSTHTLEQRRSIPGLQPKRADVILAGACLVDVILHRLDASELTISDRGLRHGLAFDLFQGNG